MPRWTLPVVFIACLLAAEVAGLAEGAGGPASAKSQLVRPDDIDDEDVKGSIKIKSQPDMLKIKIKKSDSSKKHKVFMEDAAGSGNLEKIGKAKEKNNGKWKLKYKTKKGDELPFGVTAVEMLSGRMVEVVTGGEVVLFGFVPFFSCEPNIAATTPLVRPVFGPDENATGWVYSVSKPNKGVEKLKVTVEKMGFEGGDKTYDVFLESAPGTNQFALIGKVEKVKGQPGVGKMKIATNNGDSLAFGASSVVAYEGRQIQVRDDEGVTYLLGTLEPLVELP